MGVSRVAAIKRVTLLLLVAVILVFTGFGVFSVRASEEPTQPPVRQPAIVSGSICLNRGVVPPEENHWLYIPSNPSELRTEINYAFLAGQLIESGAVDASECPVGGMGVGGYANACGISKARPVVVEIQNTFDSAILTAWQEVGVPPIMLKQMIRYESQFWPTQYGVYHFGLAHMTYWGAYNALAWNPVLYQRACDESYNGNCQNMAIDSMMVGTLLEKMVASCPTCTYKVDLLKAQSSINYIAHALLGYCRQTAQIVYNATENPLSSVIDYATIWKLTLYNYNNGPNCLYTAVQDAYDPDDLPMDWATISAFMTDRECLSGVDYVNNITAPFYEFP